jgi:hypothetical protein
MRDRKVLVEEKLLGMTFSDSLGGELDRMVIKSRYRIIGIVGAES